MLSRSIVGIQRVTRGVYLKEISKNKLIQPLNASSRFEKRKDLLIGMPVEGQYYPLLQKRNYSDHPKPNDVERFLYKGVAKFLNTVDTVSTSKGTLFAKRIVGSTGETLGTVGASLKKAYEKYFLGHWWIQFTINEYNRKLTNARRERSMKQIAK